MGGENYLVLSLATIVSSVATIVSVMVSQVKADKMPCRKAE